MNTPTPAQFTHWFHTVAPYLHAHRGKTFVLCLPGETLNEPSFKDLIHDIAILYSLGIRLAIVHSCAFKAGDFSAFKDIGQGPVSAGQMEKVMQAAGQTQYRLEAALSMSLPDSPMQGAAIQVCSGNWVVARPFGIHAGVDYEHKGVVRRIACDAIKAQLNRNVIPLLPPLGYPPTGEVFFLDYEILASELALGLEADKLIFLTPHAPVCCLPGKRPLREIQVSELNTLMNILDSAAHPLLTLAAKTCQNGVKRCHLINGQTPGSLLRELFTRDGCGTLVALDRFETIRPASLKDIGDILQLTAPLEQSGALVNRSRDLIEQDIMHFTVIERDESIIGCAALYPFAEQNCAELACVVVHPDYRNAERGAALIKHMEANAKRQGFDQLFLLTTQTKHWFVEQGYQPAELSALPCAKRNAYNTARNAQILMKSL